MGYKTLESNSISQSLNSNGQNGSKSTSLIGRPLLTADEVKQLHYKTIIFSIVGYPIFRDTIFYKKFKCYKEGSIKREISRLQKLDNSYYTVEDIKNNNTDDYTIIDKTNSGQKKQLDELLVKIKPQFDMLKYDLSFQTERKKVYLFIGFSNPLSQNKIYNITQLIDENLYEWKMKSNDSFDELYATEIEICLANME